MQASGSEVVLAADGLQRPADASGDTEGSPFALLSDLDDVNSGVDVDVGSGVDVDVGSGGSLGSLRRVEGHRPAGIGDEDPALHPLSSFPPAPYAVNVLHRISRALPRAQSQVA